MPQTAVGSAGLRSPLLSAVVSIVAGLVFNPAIHGATAFEGTGLEAAGYGDTINEGVAVDPAFTAANRVYLPNKNFVFLMSNDRLTTATQNLPVTNASLLAGVNVAFAPAPSGTPSEVYLAVGARDTNTNTLGEIYSNPDPVVNQTPAGWTNEGLNTALTNAGLGGRVPVALAVRTISNTRILAAVNGGGIWMKNGANWSRVGNVTGLMTTARPERTVGLVWPTDAAAYVLDRTTGLWRGKSTASVWENIWTNSQILGGDESNSFLVSKVTPNGSGGFIVKLYVSANGRVWRIDSPNPTGSASSTFTRICSSISSAGAISFASDAGTELYVVQGGAQPHLLKIPNPESAGSATIPTQIDDAFFDGSAVPATARGLSAVYDADADVTKFIIAGTSAIRSRVVAEPPPPTVTAVAGADQTISANDAGDAVLDATASTGSPVSYTWTWNGGSATGPVVTATFPLGSTVVTLAVTDANGSISTDTVEVRVIEPPAIIPPIPVNWNPGHYLLVGQALNTGAAVFAKATDEKFRGIQKRYWWKDIETGFGVYDFSILLSDLRTVSQLTPAPNPRHMVIQIQIKNFTGGHAVPGYLWNTTNPLYRSENPMQDGTYAYGEFDEGGNNTHQAMYWLPGVNARLRAFYTALADTINAQPDADLLNATLESIVINETACEAGNGSAGLDRELSGYTQQRCVDAMNSNLTLLRREFPGQTIFQYINFLPPSSGPANAPSQVAALMQIADHCDELYGVGVGCPDVRGINPPGYTVIRASQGLIPLSGSVQGADYQTPETLDSVWYKGLNFVEGHPAGLGSNFMVWLDQNSSDPKYGFRLGDDIHDPGTVRERIQNLGFPGANGALPLNLPLIADHIAPLISAPAEIEFEATGSAGAVGTFTATALDETDGVVPVTDTPASGSVFPLGQSTVTLQAMDAAGNVAHQTLSVVVQDTTPPAVMVPADLTLEATSPAGAVATFAATATDAVGVRSLTYSQPSGSIFPIATTTVAATATDAAGNTGIGAFTVTVTKAAATLALANTTQTYDGTPKSVTVTSTPNSVITSVTYDGSTTAPTNAGNYEVVATATDPTYTGSASGTLVISTAVLVRHAPSLNGSLDGSLQVLLPESTTLNGSASVSGDLLVPGTPALQLNGHPAYAGTLDGTGAASPSNFTITLNGNAALRHVVRRTDAATMPVVSAPPAPTGTRNVTLNNAGDSAGDFATISNLTLNGNAGARAVPAGTYGVITANGNSGLIFGVAGATTPSIYNLQGLTLNSNSILQVVGPVIINLATGVSANGSMGAGTHPEWLLINVASGGFTLNGNVSVSGSVIAPTGTVTVNGNSVLAGSVVADRLTINGNGLLDTIP